MEFDRSAFLTELENLPADTKTVAEKSENKPDPEPVVEEKEDKVEDEAPAEDEESTEEVSEASESEEKPVEQEEDAEEQLDPKTAKSLEIRQREEKRAKEAHSKRMSEIRQTEAQVKEYEGQVRRLHQEVVAEKQRLDSQRERLLTDPVGALREAGLPEDMYEYISKQFYLLSKKGLENPKARELADRERKSREVESRLDQAMRKIEEFEQRDRQRSEEQERTTVINKYLDGVEKAITAEHKLLKKWSEKAPQKVRQRLYETANELASELGYAPEPDEVLDALETARRSELEELGIRVGADVLREDTTKQPEAKKKPTTTLSSDMGATRGSTKAKSKSRDEEVQDVLSALERGQYD